MFNLTISCWIYFSQYSLAFLLIHVLWWDQEDGQALVSRLLDQLMKGDKYGERRGAAFGLAGVVKGFGISCLKKYGIVVALRKALEDRFLTYDNLLSVQSFICYNALDTCFRNCHIELNQKLKEHSGLGN